MKKQSLFLILLFGLILSACSSSGSTTTESEREKEVNDSADTAPTYISIEDAEKRKLNRDDMDDTDKENEELALKLEELIKSGKLNEVEKLLADELLGNDDDSEVVKSYVAFLKSDEPMSLRTAKLMDSVDYGYKGILSKEITNAIYSPHEEGSVITGIFDGRKGFDYMDWKYNEDKNKYEGAKDYRELGVMVEVEKVMKENLIEQAKGKNPHLGMTKEEVEASLWGRPEKINRTVTQYSSREQWVYGQGQYLYFEDGILTSFQD